MDDVLSKAGMSRAREILEQDIKSLKSNARILTARRGKKMAKDHVNLRSQYFENYPYKS